MSRANMLLWIEALRSGEFQQAREYLKLVTPEGDKYCCLGVACEVAIRNGVKVNVTVDTHPDCHDGCTYSHPVRFESGVASMPEPVFQWLGLRWGDSYGEPTDPDVLVNFANRKLSSCNDDLRKDFNEIADLIEEHLLPLVPEDPPEETP